MLFHQASQNVSLTVKSRGCMLIFQSALSAKTPGPLLGSAKYDGCIVDPGLLNIGECW